MAIIANTGHTDISTKDKVGPGWNQTPASILLDEENDARLMLATERIDSARMMFCGR